MNKNKKIALILAMVALIAAGSVLLFVILKDDSDTSQNQDEAIDSINYGPPTEEELQAGDQQKEKIESEDGQAPEIQGEVIIVDAQQYDSEVEVRAFVANIVDNGICTYRFMLADESFEVTREAFADASTTPCITLTLPVSDFPQPGTWSLEVLYASDTSDKSAQPATIDVEVSK